MIKVGKVVAIDETTARVRVELPDCDGMITYWLPVVVPKSQKDKFYWIPDIGEQVICAFLDNGLEQGFIIGAIYSETDIVPVKNKSKNYIKFSDGTVIEYDRVEHKLYVECIGTVHIKSAGSITIQAPTLNIIGNLEVQGNIHATGSIIDEGGNTPHHSH
jgi:phage baseplate assembly protein V